MSAPTGSSPGPRPRSLGACAREDEPGRSLGRRRRRVDLVRAELQAAVAEWGRSVAHGEGSSVHRRARERAGGIEIGDLVFRARRTAAF